MWNEELGEYLHPDDVDPPFEEEDVYPLFAQEDVDVDTQKHLADVYHTFSDANPPPITAVYPHSISHTPRRSYQTLLTTRAQTTYAHLPKTLPTKKGRLLRGAGYRSSSAAQPFKTTNSSRRCASRKRQRDSPPHLPASRTSAPDQVAAMAPPPPVAAESLREATKISLVDLVVHLPTQPIPPDPKTADSVAAQPVDPPALASSKPDGKPPSDDGHSPDASTKDPVPLTYPVPKLLADMFRPRLRVIPLQTLSFFRGFQSPRRYTANALRRIAQKEKVDGARGRALASRGQGGYYHNLSRGIVW
ncbi:hypothetical protein B0H10DRAFT_1948105 [Mycena sp. CBHHK59/15]|nr:hypothetical protein B0H10DRAFT_1948105 [Mycena sp. CBHHK59/15]